MVGVSLVDRGRDRTAGLEHYGIVTESITDLFGEVGVWSRHTPIGVIGEDVEGLGFDSIEIGEG